MISIFPSRTIFLQIAGLQIHWYGVMYLLAFVMAFILVRRLQKYRSLYLDSEEWSYILSWAIIGVLVGGRLGYVLFYEPMYFLLNPLDIFAVWKGGMSSHGGFVGVALAMWWAASRHNIPIWKLADIVVVPIAIGLSFGRLGNYINYELYGTVTTLPWGIAIPGVEGLRHPTQLYAVIKDLLIAGICFYHISRTAPILPGRTFALFLMLYGGLRFLTEFVRAQQYELFLGLSRGQLYTIPIFLIGVFLWFWLKKRRQ